MIFTDLIYIKQVILWLSIHLYNMSLIYRLLLKIKATVYRLLKLANTNRDSTNDTRYIIMEIKRFHNLHQNKLYTGSIKIMFIDIGILFRIFFYIMKFKNNRKPATYFHQIH